MFRNNTMSIYIRIHYATKNMFMRHIHGVQQQCFAPCIEHEAEWTVWTIVGIISKFPVYMWTQKYDPEIHWIAMFYSFTIMETKKPKSCRYRRKTSGSNLEKRAYFCAPCSYHVVQKMTSTTDGKPNIWHDTLEKSLLRLTM